MNREENITHKAIGLLNEFSNWFLKSRSDFKPVPKPV